MAFHFSGNKELYSWERLGWQGSSSNCNMPKGWWCLEDKLFIRALATAVNTEFSTTCNTKLSQISFGCKILGWPHLCWASLAKPEDIKFVPGEPYVDFCPLLEVNSEALTQWQQTGNAVGDRKIPPWTHTWVMPLISCFCDSWTVSPVKLLIWLMIQELK